MAADTKAVTAQTLKQIMDLLEATCGGELSAVIHILNENGDCSTLSSLPPGEVERFMQFIVSVFDEGDSVTKFLGSIERD